MPSELRVRLLDALTASEILGYLAGHFGPLQALYQGF